MPKKTHAHYAVYKLLLLNRGTAETDFYD